MAEPADVAQALPFADPRLRVRAGLAGEQEPEWLILFLNDGVPAIADSSEGCFGSVTGGGNPVDRTDSLAPSRPLGWMPKAAIATSALSISS